MTKDEAIKVLNDYDINFERNTPEEVAEAHEMAVRALEELHCELLILKAGFSLREAELKEWSERIKKEKEEGLIILPSYFEPILVPNDVEIKIEQEPKTEGARGDIPLQQSVPKMPQPSERTEERTETHACDCISRKAVLNIIKSICFSEEYAQFRADYGSNGQRDTVIIQIKALPSVTPQPKEEQQQKTGHWVLSGGYWRCSECKEKALLKLDKATGGYREYEPVRSKYCPKCGAKMQEVKE